MDEGKQTYQALGYKRYSWLSIWPALLNRICRATASEVGIYQGYMAGWELGRESLPDWHTKNPVRQAPFPFPLPPGYLQASARNVRGNLAGDGLQNGGLLVVKKGGDSVLLSHREEVPGDHVANDAILEALGITQLIG